MLQSSAPFWADRAVSIGIHTSANRRAVALGQPGGVTQDALVFRALELPKSVPRALRES
jgi:hypothetical protein